MFRSNVISRTVGASRASSTRFARVRNVAPRRSFLAGTSKTASVRPRRQVVAPLSFSRAVSYKVPLRDMRFVLNEVLDAPAHYAKLGYTEATEDLVDSLMDESAKFCEEVLAPLNASGDKEGCVRSENGDVKTPTGFKEAYEEYVAAGWPGMSSPEELGGQNLPYSLRILTAEMIAEANWSWGMYPGLSMGALNTILLHGNQEQKELYAAKLTEGSWTGTMCLTEPHCGSDLGQCVTKAEPIAGTNQFKINGTKIFISCGEHDMAENIVHIVLARLPDAPKGTRGISLFIVPKYLPKEDGSLATEKNIVCAGIEDKMGIKASATCTMSFEDSIGYMMGEPNTGLRQMFTFMNIARLGTAVQGVGEAELAFQGSIDYARERMSMRSLTGAKFPDQSADPLIVHPDVRRMLMIQKAVAEGGRVMLYHAAMLGDIMVNAKDKAEHAEVDDYLGLLTPIAKGFLTELGNECANHGVQVFGGHGYIKENGMEQIVRDGRISSLYEGTTGIQALDLLGRKIMLGKGKMLIKFTNEIRSEAFSLLRTKSSYQRAIRPFATTMLKYSVQWPALTAQIAFKARNNKDVIGSASVDYLMYSGYITLGFYWLRAIKTALAKLESNPPDADFYEAKLRVGEFYFNYLIKRAESHRQMALTDPKYHMQLEDEKFTFFGL